MPADDRFILRPATQADLPAVREVIFSALAEFGLRPDPASTDADLFDLDAHYASRGGRFDVAVERATGRIVGSVGLRPEDHDPGTVELRKMYLRPEARGQGLGRRLLEHALAEARRLGFRRVTLETASVLEAAIALYVRHGFRRYRPASCSSRCDQAYLLDLPPSAHS